MNNKTVAEAASPNVADKISILVDDATVIAIRQVTFSDHEVFNGTFELVHDAVDLSHRALTDVPEFAAYESKLEGE